MMKRKHLLPLFLAALLFTAFALLLSSCDSGTADGDKEPDDGYLKEGTRFFYMEATVVNPPEDEDAGEKGIDVTLMCTVSYHARPEYGRTDTEYTVELAEYFSQKNEVYPYWTVSYSTSKGYKTEKIVGWKRYEVEGYYSSSDCTNALFDGNGEQIGAFNDKNSLNEGSRLYIKLKGKTYPILFRTSENDVETNINGYKRWMTYPSCEFITYDEKLPMVFTPPTEKIPGKKFVGWHARVLPEGSEDYSRNYSDRRITDESGAILPEYSYLTSMHLEKHDILSYMSDESDIEFFYMMWPEYTDAPDVGGDDNPQKTTVTVTYVYNTAAGETSTQREFSAPATGYDIYYGGPHEPGPMAGYYIYGWSEDGAADEVPAPEGTSYTDDVTLYAVYKEGRLITLHNMEGAVFDDGVPDITAYFVVFKGDPARSLPYTSDFWNRKRPTKISEKTGQELRLRGWAASAGGSAESEYIYIDYYSAADEYWALWR